MKNHSIKSIIIVGGLSLAAASTVFASDAEDMFKRMDLNGDKKVTSTEHAQFAETSFQQSDSDRDGKVSAAECEAAQATYDKKAKIDKKSTEAHLRQVDTDGDGQINQTENASFSQSAFARADKNGDGALTEGEFEAAHKAMKKEMKDKN
jgi:Ca2+-binding EF-hand superfamily protein